MAQAAQIDEARLAKVTREITDVHLLRERVQVERSLVALRDPNTPRADLGREAINVTMSDTASTAERNEALELLKVL